MARASYTTTRGGTPKRVSKTSKPTKAAPTRVQKTVPSRPTQEPRMNRAQVGPRVAPTGPKVAPKTMPARPAASPATANLRTQMQQRGAERATLASGSPAPKPPTMKPTGGMTTPPPPRPATRPNDAFSGPRVAGTPGTGGSVMRPATTMTPKTARPMGGAAASTLPPKRPIGGAAATLPAKSAAPTTGPTTVGTPPTRMR